MNNDFIDAFIAEYEKLPSLWQTTHPDFKNRKKRQEAYQKLIECANKYNEIYNIERTKQKINNLRCAFRHQLKKYTEMKNNPKGGKEDGYCPKRKYFQSLMFLLNEEKQVIRKEANSKEITNEENDDVAAEYKISKKAPEKLTEKQQKAQKKKELDAITPMLESDNEETEQIETKLEGESPKVQNQRLSIEDQEEDDDFKSLITISNQMESKEQQNESDDDINLLLLKQKSVTGTTSTTTLSPPKYKEDLIKPSVTITKTSVAASKTSTSICSQQITSTPPARVVQMRTVKPTTLSVRPPVASQIINTSPRKRTFIAASPSSTVAATITVQSPPLTKNNTQATKIIFPSKVQVNSQQQPPANQFSQKSPTSIPVQNVNQRPTTATLALTQTPVATQIPKMTTSIAAIEPATKKIKIDCDSSNFEKLLSLACNRLTQFEENEDDYGVFGKMVTSKLRTMETEQSIIAQKLIADILFDGQMKLLQMPQTQHNAYLTSNTISAPTQQLHGTTIRPLRGQLSTNGQTFFFSELNGNNQFSAGNNDDNDVKLLGH